MEVKSKYLELFSKLKEGDKFYTLKNNLVLVERIDEGERRSKSGLIIDIPNKKLSPDNILSEKPHFCVVLDVGEGYTDDSGDIIPNSMSVKPGDIILVPSISVKYFSLFGGLLDYVPDSVGLVKESEIQLHFEGKDSFEKYFKILNLES
jgi:co-chaperonin GroES (HSP10)